MQYPLFGGLGVRGLDYLGAPRTKLTLTHISADICGTFLKERKKFS